MEVRTGPCLCGEPEKVVEKDGVQILVRCPLFKFLEGTHPKTGKPIEGWDCAISWLMTLIMENTRQAIGVSASIDSLRNVVDQGQRGVSLLNLLAAQPSGPEDIVDATREVTDASDDHRG